MNMNYYEPIVRTKSKGAGKGTKVYVDGFRFVGSRKRFLEEFEETDPKGCGLFLAKIEWHDFVDDRWWDTESYREEAVRDYREKIKNLRQRYGLSKSEVSEYMRVN